jgi:peptidoglycan/xylan/chitin deacetylase (PgdA/CDA1 family)
LQFVHRRLRPLPPDELLATVDELLRVLAAPDPPENARTMSTAQLTTLSEWPGVDIGAHTRTHLQLQDQSARLQEDEVAGSVADLASALGRPVTSFAYPFGSDGAVGSLAPSLTRQSGCVVACTTEPGPVVRRSDPHLLPRLNVRDWEADQLARAIAEVVGRG